MTRQQAINAKRKDCIYDQLDTGTWKDQVTACMLAGCPLYEFSPLNTALFKQRLEAKIYDCKQAQMRARFSK
jgi:hypothetical protein